jgi:hypothetical protein
MPILVERQKYKFSNMDSKVMKQNGRLETLLIAAIIMAITMVTNFSKEIFVEQSGNIQIFGNFGLLMVAGLIWKWKYTRKVLSILTFIALLAIIMSVIMVKTITFPFLMLLAGLIIAFYLSTFSNNVKVYFDEELK